MNKKKNKNIYRTLFLLFAVIPPLANFAIFYVYVNADAFFRAFFDIDGNLTLSNFSKIIVELQKDTTDLATAFKNTFLIFGITLACYPFKVLVSYFIYKKIPFAGFYRIVFFMPSIVFSVCTALVFQRVVGPTGALAKAVGEWLNLGYTPEFLADSQFANKVVILHMLWLGFPGDLIVWGGTFTRIPEELIESGRVDGVTWWQEFTKIIVPLVWPTISLQMVLMFAGIFSASGASFLLTGGEYGTETFSSWMYKFMINNTSGYAGNVNAFNFMAALGMVVTIITLAISLAVRKISDKMHNDIEF